MTAFSDIELDVITELTNIGVGRAAASLSELVQDEIRLTVPTCKVTSRQEAIEYFEQETKDDLVCVRESFSGSLCGDGLLLFPKQDSLELVQCLIPEHTPLEVLTEMEQDALIEVGNIILNACIGTYSNVLGQQLMTAIPEILKGSSQGVFGSSFSEDHSSINVLLINVSFSINSRNVRGYVIFLMDLQSEELFRSYLLDYIESASPEVQSSC